MRPLPIKAAIAITALLLSTVVGSGIAVAQRNLQSTPPAAIISSGGFQAASETRPSPPPTAPNWTSQNSAAFGAGGGNPANLRPQQPVHGYPELPTGNNAVVTASAQVSTAAPANAAVEHIPLAPPSARFTGEEKGQATSSAQMLVSVGSSLILVVGLFLGVAWCYRKTLSSVAHGGLPKQVVNVLGRTPISARQQMVLVRFGSKLLLVSVIQGEARTLSEITDPLEVDQLAGLCASSQPDSISSSFRNILSQGGAR